MDKFKPYLFGPQFTWITDSKCLPWLHRVKDTSPKLLRWCLQIQGIDFTVQHKPGKQNVAPDALSRVIRGYARKSTRVTSPIHEIATLSPLLDLIVEPLVPYADYSYDVAFSYNTARDMSEDHQGPASDDNLTDFVASVANALPDRVAQAQRADPYFGSIIQSLNTLSSARTVRHGSEYALSCCTDFPNPNHGTLRNLAYAFPCL
jgi:RNase H-like domain found in reverse transcriptase